MEIEDEWETSSLDSIAKKVADIFEPTPEEIQRTLTKEELIRLCSHKKCHVDMGRWNPIFAFYCKLKRRGKIQNKSPRKVNKILKNLGNYYKNDPRRVYSTIDIEKERNNRWKYRKMFNLIWLENNEKENYECSLGKHSSDESLITIIPQKFTNNEIPLSVTPVPPTYMKQLNINPSNMECGDNIILDSENLDRTDESESTSEESNSLLHLEDAVSDIIGTQSMPTNVLSESQPALLFEADYDNYEDFHISIPVTSTQSQESD